MTSLVHGTYQDTCIYFSQSTGDATWRLYRFAAGKIKHVDQLLTIMREKGIHTLWITPGCDLAYTQEGAWNKTEDWELWTSTRQAPSDSEQTGIILTSITARPKVRSGGSSPLLRVIWPELGAWNWTKRNVGAVDAITVLGAVNYLETELNTQVVSSPGIVGRALIEQRNKKWRAEWIAPVGFDFDQLPRKLGFDLDHVGLTMQKGAPGMPGTYLHCWDKNSMYLAAASSVELGVGAPEHVKETFEAEQALCKLPGYWRINPSCVLGLDINPLYKSQEWITTPLLDYILKQGIQPTILEAWIWRQKGRILDTFASFIWKTRQDFKGNAGGFRSAASAELAYYSVKRIATASVGIFNNKDTLSYKPQWYRPDWRAHIIEAAKARMLFKIDQIKRLRGLMPVVVDVDQVMYVSDERDPSIAIPEFERAGSLGGWKLAHSVPLTDELAGMFDGECSPGEIAAAVAAADTYQVKMRRAL